MWFITFTLLLEKFTKNSLCFTREISQVHKFTSSQVTHLKNYLGEQNNRRTTEEENGWNTPFIKFLPPHLRTPSPKRMLRAHAQHQWTLGAHQHPPPTDRYEQPLPPKGCWERMRNLSGRWGRISPLPQETGTSNPFPNRPVRATPSPKKDAECACATSVDAGGASDPLSPRDRYEQPLPPTPPSLYKGVTDRAQT